MVMGLIGGSLTGPLIFILPPLFYTKLNQLEEIHDEMIEQIENNCEFNDELLDYEMGQTKSYGSIPQIRFETRRRGEFCGGGLCGRFIFGIYDFMHFICSDCIISIFVVGFGIGATIVSTYTNLFDLSQLVQWSPCLSNQTFNFLKI